MHTPKIELEIPESSFERIREIVENAVKNHMVTAPVFPDEKPYLTTKEAERFSGFSSSTLYSYKCRGILKANKNAGKILWARTDLLKLMGVEQ